MYVIFPADEVVCLSYGRVIYIPTNSEQSVIPATPPVRTTAAAPTSSVCDSCTSAPSTSTTGSTKSRQSTASEPIFALKNPKATTTSSTKSLSGPPQAPLRKHKKCTAAIVPVDQKPARKQSFNDFLQVSRERTGKRDRSPVLRGKSASPCVRTPFDFDSLFNKEASPVTTSLHTLPVNHSFTGEGLFLETN